MSFLDSALGKLFRSNKHLLKVNEELLAALSKAFVVPDAPPVVIGASVDSVYLNQLLSRYAGLPIEKVRMDDSLYDIPYGTNVWQQVYHWLYPVLSTRYRNAKGTDCEDLAARAEQFFRHFWADLDSFTIGVAIVTLPQGTRHATSVVLWTDKNWEIRVGFMEFSPPTIFREPPPFGLFTLEETKWVLEEIQI